MLKNNDNQQLALDLFRAYYDARKNKQKSSSVLNFEENYQKKLFKLYDEIVSRNYKIGPSVCFVVTKPVRREIFAADFRDRIVHHLIFNYINPLIEKHFIKDSYSCRLKKGTSFGIKRVDHFLRSCSENYQKDCWILKLDIEGYFMAMDRNILYAKCRDALQRVSTDFDINLILYLIKTIVFNDPTKNCQVKGKREDWVGLPKSKSLFFAKKDKGFPIGNLTSQLFGNIYLDEFDHFIKEKLKIKYYGRYVDDMVLVHDDKDYLKSIIPEIRNYLQDQLALTLHPKKIYFQPATKGVKFLGTFILPHRIYINKRTKKNFRAAIEYWNGFIKKIAETSQPVETPPPVKTPQRGVSTSKIKNYMPKFLASMNSYLGIMRHYQTHKLRRKMLQKLSPEFGGQVAVAEDFTKLVDRGREI